MVRTAAVAVGIAVAAAALSPLQLPFAQDGGPAEETFSVRVGPTAPVGEEIITTMAGRGEERELALTSWFSPGARSCPARSTPTRHQRRAVTSVSDGPFKATRFDRPRRSGPHRVCVYLETLRRGRMRPDSRSSVLAGANVLLVVPARR